MQNDFIVFDFHQERCIIASVRCGVGEVLDDRNETRHKRLESVRNTVPGREGLRDGNTFLYAVPRQQSTDYLRAPSFCLPAAQQHVTSLLCPQSKFCLGVPIKDHHFLKPGPSFSCQSWDPGTNPEIQIHLIFSDNLKLNNAQAAKVKLR